MDEISLPAPTRSDASAFVGGVPLGGLGTGTVEIRADGSFREWQIFNNWGNALVLRIWKYAPPYDLLNAFIALKVGDEAFVLETSPALGLPGVRAIEYDGKFPFANLRYSLPEDVPLSASLEAFSSFIPHRPEDSGLPAFGLTFRFRNRGDKPLDVTLAASFVNPLGDVCTTDGFVASCDGPYGGLAAASLDAPARFVLGGKDDAESLLSFWQGFSQGAIQGNEEPAEGQRFILVIPVAVPLGGEWTLRLVVGWFFPNHRENGTGPLVGHRYQAWFNSAREVVREFARRYDVLLAESATWRDTICDASWPSWVSDLLVNIQANLVKSSWWVHDGRFVQYESFNCPNCSPVHLIDLANWLLLDLFPELELDLLSRYADVQYPSGQMPEQWGDVSTTGPSITHPGGRDLVDLSPKYAVEVWHRFKETGDEGFLQHTWPPVRRAIHYAERFDEDGDGLPDHVGGSRTSWDLWDLGYLPSYTATMWLAGLRAAEVLANAVGEKEEAERMRSRFLRGLDAIKAKLWNGEYYAFSADPEGRQSPICMVDQIYGELLAEFTGLGELLPPEHTKQALRAIAKYNGAPSLYGLVCGALPDGSIVIPDDDRVQIIVCWMLPTVIGLIRNVDLTEGLMLLRRIYDTFTAANPGGLWDIPDCILASNGKPHPRAFHHYLRTQCLWSLLKILQGWEYNAVEKALTVAPVFHPEKTRGPWITPTAYGKLWQEVGRTQHLKLEVRRGFLELASLSTRPLRRALRRASVRINGAQIPARSVPTEGRLRVEFSPPVILRANDILDVEWG